jgi:hypothetical protein
MKTAAILLLLLFPARVWAILFYGTGDASFNTTAPTGTLAGSGWDYEGNWGPGVGTAISPDYFITAQHLGGGIGSPFVYQGQSFQTIGYTDCPGTDLRLWQVAGTFSSYAPIYSQNDEAGRNIVVFGRGTQRGDPVTVNSQLKGWTWGNYDGVLRWGQSQVHGTIQGGTGIGSLLQLPFQPGLGPNAATLSGNDSGGGVFVQVNQTWYLAGVNYAVDGPFNTSNSGSGFNAAIFDARGLYYGGPGNWQLVPDGPTPVTTSFYASEISASAGFIDSVIFSTVPEAGGAGQLLPCSIVAAAALMVRRRQAPPPATAARKR